MNIVTYSCGAVEPMRDRDDRWYEPRRRGANADRPRPIRIHVSHSRQDMNRRGMGGLPEGNGAHTHEGEPPCSI